MQKPEQLKYSANRLRRSIIPVAKALIIAVWLVPLALSMVAAFRTQGNGGDASGWWQVVIDLIALPTIIYSLLALRERKPRVIVGVVPGHPLYSEIRRMESLHKELTLESSQSGFSLVIRNAGNSAARFVKVVFENECHDEIHLHIISHLTISPTGEIIYPSRHAEGGHQLTIYSNDEEVFQFRFDEKELPQLTFPLTISLNCRVVADGLDSPVNERLLINLKQYAA